MRVFNKEIDPQTLLNATDRKTGWRPELVTDQYHADKTALNFSSVKHVKKSPYAFAGSFWGPPKEPTPAMKFGTLVHMAILEPMKFKTKYVVQPEFTGYTQKGELTTSLNCKEVKDKIARWQMDQEPGAVIVTEQEREDIFCMIDSVLSHPMASKLLTNGQPETPGYWIDPTTGLPCRMMPDFLAFNADTLTDFKTCADSSWEAFRKSVEKLHYDVQMAMYDDGVFHITGIRPQHNVWLATENVFPFETRVHEVDPIYKAAGRFQYRENMNKIKQCLKNGEFPQGQLDIIMSQPSSYYFKEYEQKGAFINEQ